MSTTTTNASPSFHITKEYADELISERIGETYTMPREDWEDLVLDISCIVRETVDMYMEDNNITPKELS